MIFHYFIAYFSQSILQLHSIKTGQIFRKHPLRMKSFGSMSLDKTQTEMFFDLKSFLSPATVYRYNFTDPNAEPTVFYKMKPNVNGFDEANYDVEQVFYPSRDGTKIPMFIVQKKTTKNQVGSRPTLLYGYGGFNSPQLPTFQLDWFFFVNSFDGVLAVANIRGGGEYGSKWHRDGILLKKQNSYDDFHAAAEYLIENQYTTPNKLAIRGESNGGLLVGACINQRPDLYGAAVAQVGIMDMIRYYLFVVQTTQIPEFGDPEKRADFMNILKYSPLHNIHTPNSTKKQYPATLITTADHDDVVSPLHSFKYTATLQHAVQGNQHQSNPILMKLLKDAGHSDLKPTYKLIDQESDILTFLYRALSIEKELRN